MPFRHAAGMIFPMIEGAMHMDTKLWSEACQYKGLQGERKRLSPDFMEQLRMPQLPFLREGVVGDYSIKVEIIPAGEKVTVVSQRNWLMMGYVPFKVIFDKPRLVFKLFRKGHGLLMSDSPQEMFLQYDAYMNAKGRVLVGGLGLGLFAAMAAKKESVTEVVVIEIDEDVMKLCQPKDRKIKVVQGDIWDFIRNTSEKFDYAYIDIHYHTGCMEYIRTVLPMRKILSERFPNMPADFWGEEEMKAQYNPNYDKEKAEHANV